MTECPWCDGGGLAADGETPCDVCGGSGKRCDALETVAREINEWFIETHVTGFALAMDLREFFPKRRAEIRGPS